MLSLQRAQPGLTEGGKKVPKGYIKFPHPYLPTNRQLAFSAPRSYLYAM